MSFLFFILSFFCVSHFSFSEQPAEDALKPFGANLFEGSFSKERDDGLNADYVIAPGDRVAVNAWGSLAINNVFVVDGQGNIFLPDIGPVHLEGVKNKDLTGTVKTAIGRVYKDNFGVYTNLLSAKPVNVFLSGYVKKPGRYAGLPSDSILFFLDRCEGIQESLGSYRSIDIIRQGKTIKTVDLYDFLLKGSIPTFHFKDGDTILVKKRGSTVSLTGDIAKDCFLEFKKGRVLGKDTLSIIPELSTATEITLEGMRGKAPIVKTYTLDQFKKCSLQNGDRILIRSDGKKDHILVSIEGEHLGSSVLSLPKGTLLMDTLNTIPVDLNLANIKAIHLHRKSVVKAQKKAIQDSLFRLQKDTLLALSSSNGEVTIRKAEAELVKMFVERAKLIEPLGRVVTSDQGRQQNIILEDGDKIIIPSLTNVVQISGEVFAPQALIYKPGTSANDYVQKSGGFSQRADEEKIIIFKANGGIETGEGANIEPGDHILIPPKVDEKSLQNGMDLADVIYKIAISAGQMLLAFRK